MKPRKGTRKTGKAQSDTADPVVEPTVSKMEVDQNEEIRTNKKDDPNILQECNENHTISVSRRMTRSSTKPNTFETDRGNGVGINKLSKKISDDEDEELLSLDEDSNSYGSPSESDSEDSDFVEEVIKSKGTKSLKKNTSKLRATKKNSITNSKNEKALSLKRSTKCTTASKSLPILDSSDDSDDDDFVNKNLVSRSFGEFQVGKQSRIDVDKRQNNSVPKLEDTTDESTNEDDENNGTGAMMTASSGKIFHETRPVDHSFTKKQQGVSSTDSTSPAELAKLKSRKRDIEKILAIEENSNRRISNDNNDETSETSSKEEKDRSNIYSSDESSVDWEEVEAGGDLTTSLDNEQYSFPEEGVVVTLPNEGAILNRRKGKKESFVDQWLRNEMNQNTKVLQLRMHQAHVLCLLARGILINNWLRSEELLGVALSVLPSQQAYPPKHLNLSYIEKFLKWFRATYPVEESENNSGTVVEDFEENLKSQILSKNCINYEMQLYVFNAILRSLGVDTRVICSFQPIPLKPPMSSLIKPPKMEDDEEEDKLDSKKSTAVVKSSRTTKKAPLKKSSKKLKSSFPVNNTKKPSRKIISSDEDQSEEEDTVPTENKPAKQCRDFWTEVYLEEEERWVSVDITTAKILCDNELEASATQPLSYVVGFENKGQVRDVTRRYASRWLTATQKLRVDCKWWDASLKPFRGRRTARDRDEDEFLDQQLINQPLPQSLAEYKGHPLYALSRYLLKFEALYPLEPIPLGFVRNTPVYSRECVRTLHARELWSKKAKVVRMGELPYKIVKARPKFSKFSNQTIKDLPLELFGEWQVEDFVPPVAKDGKVPRNAYGNVELFQEKMLPKGTVYLQLPGLGRVAKKLDIDCAPALTGFEFSRGGSHPVFDGFVVCEEFKEVLLDAWNQDQDELRKKNEEKRLKRVYGNWAKLLKGLLIQRKLETKYNHTFTKRKLDENGDEPCTSANAKKRQKK